MALDRTATELAPSALPEGHWLIARLLQTQSLALTHAGQFEAAIPILEEGLDFCLRHRGKEDMITREFYKNLVEIHGALEQWEEADRYRAEIH